MSRAFRIYLERDQFKLNPKIIVIPAHASISVIPANAGIHRGHSKGGFPLSTVTIFIIFGINMN